MRLLNRNPLDFVERNLILSAVIKLGCSRRFMVGDLLRHFQLFAVLQIRRDAGRAEGMIVKPRFDAGLFLDQRTLKDRFRIKACVIGPPEAPSVFILFLDRHVNQ
jgi:hypothetical protein